MTILKTKDSIEGLASEVFNEIEKDYPDVAQLTREVLCAMLLTNTKELTFDDEVYDTIHNAEIKITTDGDKVTIQILEEAAYP